MQIEDECPFPEYRVNNAKNRDRCNGAPRGRSCLTLAAGHCVTSRRAIGSCVCSSCLCAAGLRGKNEEGYNIQQMLEILTAQNVPVKLCKTCTDGRGIGTLPD